MGRMGIWKVLDGCGLEFGGICSLGGGVSLSLLLLRRMLFLRTEVSGVVPLFLWRYVSGERIKGFD